MHENGVGNSAKRAEPGVTDGLATKKRKAAKVVGADEDATTALKPDTVKKGNEEKAAKKTKKKAKLIKLAFDDEGEDG